MSLIRWSPNYDPFKEMEEMMKNFPALSSNNSLQSFMPAVNMYEEKDNVVVEANLPGMDPKNLEVSIEKGVLTLKGETKSEHEVDEKNYYRKEIRSGTFFRQVPLPTAIKDEKVSAEICDGLLKITCPKANPTKGKKIDVKIKSNKK